MIIFLLFFFFCYLDDVNNTPLTAPNVDIATNTGMIHAIGPYKRSAKVFMQITHFAN
jgi:hypothetical protein